MSIVDGPNRGLTSGGWRVWTVKEDTYIAGASTGGMWKASLHSDDAWQLAATKEQRSSERPVWAEEDRAPWKFQPTPFVDGVRLAFAIGVFRHALCPLELDSRDIQVSIPDRWDVLNLAMIRMTEPDVEYQAENLIGEPLSLRSGRRVWVESATQSLPDGEPEPQAVGAMIVPVSPEADGTASPGVLLRGVHIG